MQALQSPLHVSPLRTGGRAGGWCLCNYRRCDRHLCGLYWRTIAMRSCCLRKVVAYVWPRYAAVLSKPLQVVVMLLQPLYPVTLHNCCRQLNR
ncbi:hypothetical protein B296_00010564 [Ensete ventricosum]|uniref:Uncharacterized protein n=1 Tax=Ensete ventricosum TaxID=4639 RepID=A0A426Z6H6_ENSVE|nr:hypothetical protein B296_00010564 [Ensete ventricosum]